MAIMKMNMVNIVGPIKDFERVAMSYVAGNNIHTENVFTVLDNIKGLYAYSEDSKVFDVEGQALALINLGQINETEILAADNYREYETCAPTNMECILKGLAAVKDSIVSLEEEKKMMSEKLQEYDELRKQLCPIEAANINLNRLYEFEFIKFRFGKMPVKSYRILYEYLEEINVLFLKTSEDKEYVWGVYFAPEENVKKVDAIFSSLYFERVRISTNVHGTPRNSLDYIDSREEYRKNRIKEIENEISELLKNEDKFIIYAKKYSEKIKKLQEIKRLSGHTKESFYIVGWMTKKDADKLEKELEKEEQVVFLREEPENVLRVTPPTKLKNMFMFKPFEMFVTMYGLPSYNEFDPTWIFALSYFIMFGAMFGDLGQGFVLFAGGFLLYKLKNNWLGAVIGTVGVSSMAFGIIYGSVFGDEEIIHGFNPMENIMSALKYAVFFGVGIIIFVMLINIIIGIKNKDARKTFFNQNGIAGLILYATAAYTVVSMIFLGKSISTAAIVIIILMVLIIMMQEPLAHLAEKRKNWMPKNKGMFLLESFFEMFEILLSFTTNTLSFLRVGAFALNHVGMMSVVKILAEMIGKGEPNIIVLILGNILVIGLEGLVVGIQTLRLEYFEMFSRFYTGEGREFRSLNENKN